jgi:hypothetical protein
MAPSRPPRVRDRQRGNSLLIALIVMSALATLGSLTVVSVQSSLKVSTNDRAQAIATYAAESGAAVAMDYLRSLLPAQGAGFARSQSWDTLLSTALPGTPLPFPSNGAPPGPLPSLLDPKLNASYSVVLFNNRDDPGGPASNEDWTVIIRSTGVGPQGSVAIVEWEVQAGFDRRPFILLGWHIVSM